MANTFVLLIFAVALVSIVAEGICWIRDRHR